MMRPWLSIRLPVTSVRIGALRVTPAMELGVTDHHGRLEDMIDQLANKRRDEE